MDNFYNKCGNLSQRDPDNQPDEITLVKDGQDAGQYGPINNSPVR